MNSFDNRDRKLLILSVIKLIGILFFISLIIDFTDFDRTIANLIYQWEGNQWHLKNEWVTSILIHKGGKYFSIAMLLFVFVLLISSYFHVVMAPWKKRLRYLLIATLSGTLCVSLGKTVSSVSCPWDFFQYGGSLEYIPLMEQLWVRNGSQCFPAGHASAGFAWVALYFVGLHTKSTWRWWALGFAIFLGCLFGISQQLRGAHFLSHDIWSFGICWIVSLVYYEMTLRPYELAQ